MGETENSSNPLSKLTKDACKKCDTAVNPDEAAMCSICKSIFHFSCDNIESREKWIKRSIQSRNEWKCNSCKSSKKDMQSTINQLQEQIKKLMEQNESLRLTNTLLLEQLKPDRSSITPPDINFQHNQTDQNTTSQNQRLYTKFPRYLEDLIKEIPTFNTDDPWEILKFISKLFDLNSTNPQWFDEIFRRATILQNNPILFHINNLMADQTITFKIVSGYIIQQLINVRTRTYLIARKVLRAQIENESFRNYVFDVRKFAAILGNYSEPEILEIIFSGVNLNTRTRFQFNERPKNLSELETLISQVERLEVSYKAEFDNKNSDYHRDYNRERRINNQYQRYANRKNPRPLNRDSYNYQNSQPYRNPLETERLNKTVDPRRYSPPHTRADPKVTSNDRKYPNPQWRTKFKTSDNTNKRTVSQVRQIETCSESNDTSSLESLANIPPDESPKRSRRTHRSPSKQKKAARNNSQVNKKN